VIHQCEVSAHVIQRQHPRRCLMKTLQVRIFSTETLFKLVDSPNVHSNEYSPNVHSSEYRSILDKVEIWLGNKDIMIEMNDKSGMGVVDLK
jgi:hypothetical protein